MTIRSATLLSLVLFLSLALSGTAAAEYEISLKSGRVVKADEFTEDDEKIYIYRYGGTFSFKKSSIASIKELHTWDNPLNHEVEYSRPDSKKKRK